MNAGFGSGIAPRLVATAASGLALIHAMRILGPEAAASDWLIVWGLFLLACLMVAQLMRQHYPHLRMGACNFVTLMRLALTCGLLAPLLAGNAGGYGITGFALFALALDGVDGWLARRSGLVSGFGARFDIEVDAAFALVLSLHALSIGSIGPEILLLGFMRYAFVAAGLLLPWLAAPLPFSHRRRLVCIVQMVVLIALQLPVLPEEFALLLTWLAVFALLWSFGADILWLRRECR